MRGNTVDGNIVDGISIQIGSDRHSLIEDNVISNSGRVGLLLSGREYQAWDPLENWASRLANSSHILVQRNTFSNNTVHDVFTTSTRSLVLASNCGVVSQHLGDETDVVAEIGGCGLGEGRPAPSAVLADPGPVTRGVPLQLDASASTPGVAGDALSFTWLVQAAGETFPSGTLPPLVLGVEQGGPTQWVTLTAPGIYDINVTAHDGHLGALASRSVVLFPTGTRLGGSASDWSYECVGYPECETTFANDAGLEGTSVRVTTNAPGEFVMTTPTVLSARKTRYTRLGFFLRASNPNDGGWQGNYPVIVLGTSTGPLRYEPAVNLLPTQPTEWTYVEVPLGGGDGWKITEERGSPANLRWLEIHMDTWGGDPFDVWVDAITLY